MKNDYFFMDVAYKEALKALKEDDYQFLVYARYGEDVDISGMDYTRGHFKRGVK